MATRRHAHGCCWRCSLETNDIWVWGDGGPLVLLQAGALPHWQGAEDFEVSLLNDGSVETDYDAICRCPDGGAIFELHGRQGIVLSDSEWPACFVQGAWGEILLVQSFDDMRDPVTLAMGARVTIAPERYPFRMVDSTLRLLVGADDGSGTLYGYVDARLTPGDLWCDISCS